MAYQGFRSKKGSLVRVRPTSFQAPGGGKYNRYTMAQELKSVRGLSGSQKYISQLRSSSKAAKKGAAAIARKHGLKV